MCAVIPRFLYFIFICLLLFFQFSTFGMIPTSKFLMFLPLGLIDSLAPCLFGGTFCFGFPFGFPLFNFSFF